MLLLVYKTLLLQQELSSLVDLAYKTYLEVLTHAY